MREDLSEEEVMELNSGGRMSLSCRERGERVCQAEGKAYAKAWRLRGNAKEMGLDQSEEALQTHREAEPATDQIPCCKFHHGENSDVFL